MASTSMPMPTSTSTTTPTIHIPPSVLDTLIDVFWNMLVSKWIAAAGLVAMLYDIVLTLEDEIEVIWKKKKVLSSVLYLANRYLAVPILLMFNYHIAEFRGPVSDDFCRAEVLLNLIMWGICLAISSWLLFLRVISLWNQNKPVVYSVYAAFVIIHLITWIVGGVTIGQMYSSIAYFAPVKVCGADGMGMIPKVYWLIITLECYVFALQIVHHYSHSRFRRKHNLPTMTLMRTLYNDGYVYYICVITLRLFTTLVWEFGPGSLWYAGGQFEFTLTVALASRFHLHLRRAALRPTATGMSYKITDDVMGVGKKHEKDTTITSSSMTATGFEGGRIGLDVSIPLSTIRSDGGIGDVPVPAGTVTPVSPVSPAVSGSAQDRRRFRVSWMDELKDGWGGGGGSSSFSRGGLEKNANEGDVVERGSGRGGMNSITR